jgi:D-alanyl-D-alanine carboxypeptidase
VRQSGSSVQGSAHPVIAGQIALATGWLEAQIANHQAPGFAVALVHDGEQVWSHGFGQADLITRTPISARSVFRIASISKVFTAIAIVQLRDEGRLRLDDRVEEHVPWFRLRRGHPGGPPVTIRALLTHTAGLPRDCPGWNDLRFPDQEQLRTWLADQDAVFASETRWKYSNIGISLAAAVIASASGRSYEEQVEQRICAPLGLTDTIARTIAADHPRLVVGYGRRSSDGTRPIMGHSDFRALAGAANLSSTVEDIAKLMSFFLRPGPDQRDAVLSWNSTRDMRRVQWLHDDWASGWGLGLRIVRAEGRTLVGHNGWTCGYRSAMVMSPAENIGVVLMANADDVNPNPIAQRICLSVAAAVAEARPVPPPAVPDPAWTAYIGWYRSSFCDLRVAIINGRLAAVDPESADRTIMWLVPSAGGFRIDSPDGFGSPGEQARFETGADGSVRALMMGALRLERIIHP